MAGEGEGGSGGGGGGGSGGGGGGGAGPDAGAIIDYLNHQNWFGKDGDYTGNAGYYGDNIGPVGSKQPEQEEPRSESLLKALMAPGGSEARPSMPASGLFNFVGADVDLYAGLPLCAEHPDPYTGWPAADPFTDVDPPPRIYNSAPFSAFRQTSLLSSPFLLADNSAIAPVGNGTPPSADWQEDLKRLADQRNAPVLAYIDGQFRSLPSYTTKELVIRANEQDQMAPAVPVPPQQPPPAPDHRYGLYIFKQAAEQASQQSTRSFKEGRYFEGLVGLGVRAFVGAVADLENLMPYNAPDHFLSAGQYAQRWIWYDMRGHAGLGLLELAKGQDEAGAALGGVELALGAAKSLAPSGLRLDPAFTPTDRTTKLFVDNGIVRAQKNTGNAYSYNTPTNARVVAKTLREIDASKPGAAIYVGSGGHGEPTGVSFVTDKSLLEPRFYAQDQVTVKSLQEIGIGKVLDLSNPAEAQIFKNAEQMALEPGQDAVFTVRAWCFSSRSCF